MSIKPKLKLDAQNRVLNIISVILFMLYLVLLVWLISFKCNLVIPITDTYYIFGKMTWLEKLVHVWRSLRLLFGREVWSELLSEPRQHILNVVALIPLGMYLGYFSKGHKLIKTAVASFLVSLMFETLQLITNMGCFEAMDLLTNTFGGIIGYIVYLIIYRNTPTRIRILNIASFLALPFVVWLVCHAVINTANMFDFYMDILLRRL